MPYLATDSDGATLAPEQADRDVSYTCPSCGDVLKLRTAHERDGAFVSAHFWHPSPDLSGCGGESDTHKRMKSIAMSKAKNKWPESTVEWERAVSNRRADVLVTFDTPHPRLGDGVAIECQYKNTDKPVGVVSEDFTQAGVSVLWLRPEHFSGRDVDFDAGRMVTVLERQLPAVSEWSGYHGIVTWLRQEKPTTVEVEIPFPIKITPVSPDQAHTGHYQHIVRFGPGPQPCTECNDPAVVLARDPVDRSAVDHPGGAFFCGDCWGGPDLTAYPKGQSRMCADCGDPHVVGDMYPYRADYQQLKRGADHPFQERGVEWYCHRCAGDLPPLSDLR